MSTAIATLSASRLEALVEARNAAVAMAERVARTLEVANDEAAEGMRIASAAYGQSPRWSGLYGEGVFSHAVKASRHIEGRVMAERKRIDASVWMMLYTELGLWDAMSTRQREELDAELEGDPPPVTVESARARMVAVIEGSEAMVRQAWAEAFTALDRRYKSNDPACLRAIGNNRRARIIIADALNDWGRMYSSDRAWSRIADVERIFTALDDRAALAGDDGKAPVSLFDTVKAQSYAKRIGSPTISRYFELRLFKNGNAHLWFTRPDLVERVNIELAAYYGAVLPDGVPKDEPVVTTSLAKDLSFYRTPPAVVQRLKPSHWQPCRVLEPSAGDGAIVEALLADGHTVDAIEVDPSRVRALTQIAHDRLTVGCANFLRMTPRPVYDWVVMNPPFYGTHWISHVRHAFEFLAPGGRLRAVLPITADLGTSKAHKAFRKWALPYLGGWRAQRGQLLIDLPRGSFKDSGTMVETGILEMEKPQ